MAIQATPILNANIYECFHFKFGKVFVNPKFDDLDLDNLGLKFWDVTNLPPLNKISS